MAFGKSQVIKYLPNANDIMGCLSDFEIFEFYLGGVPRKPISSPLREDTKPSFSVFHSKKHDKIFFKDFATGESGDCFLFVMRLFNIQKKTDVFNKIARDFNLSQFQLVDSSSDSSPILSYVDKKNTATTVKHSRLKISVTVRDWKLRDKDYWQGKYGLTKAQLEYCNIYIQYLITLLMVLAHLHRIYPMLLWKKKMVIKLLRFISQMQIKKISG